MYNKYETKSITSQDRLI